MHNHLPSMVGGQNTTHYAYAAYYNKPLSRPIKGQVNRHCHGAHIIKDSQPCLGSVRHLVPATNGKVRPWERESLSAWVRQAARVGVQKKAFIIKYLHFHKCVSAFRLLNI